MHRELPPANVAVMPTTKGDPSAKSFHLAIDLHELSLSFAKTPADLQINNIGTAVLSPYW
jgi:hypothetical protein